MTKRQFYKNMHELLKQSVLVQGVIALSMVFVICYLYITGQLVPSELINIVLLILGFYFGSKSQAATERGIKAYENNPSNNPD